MENKLIVITGPTASGKTELAVALASKINGEIISADSRQVYKGLDIGTGKDLNSYQKGGRKIPYHLIDISEAGEKYDVFQFQQDFNNIYAELEKNNIPGILCGGSGMYIESVVKDYNLQHVPHDPEFRDSISGKKLEELVNELTALTTLHNTTDATDRNRTIRALEIARFQQENRQNTKKEDRKSIVFLIEFPREELKERIANRLKTRMQEGMIDEVRNLLKQGVRAETLLYYGLEYRYVTMHLKGEITHEQLIQDLTRAIWKFSKKQMTWFRRMERNGVAIIRIDGRQAIDDKLKFILQSLDI